MKHGLSWRRKRHSNDYTFWKDKRKIDIKDWNIEMNKKHSMSLIERHPNPVIKWEEGQRRAIILSMVKSACKGKKRIIADVGCEEGYLSKQMLHYASKIYCVDIDPRLLSVARTRIHHEKARFLESDAQSLLLPQNTADISVSSHVLEHLPSPRKGLVELCRITKPKGTIIINVPNERVVLFLKKVVRTFGLGFLFGKLSSELAPGHLHVFDKKF
jgi:2-polyprenyl-3-methyl-5-hydroxy-6-metoxy-1,4-benzoquinol methylase